MGGGGVELSSRSFSLGARGVGDGRTIRSRRASECPERVLFAAACQGKIGIGFFGEKRELLPLGVKESLEVGRGGFPSRSCGEEGGGW